MVQVLLVTLLLAAGSVTLCTHVQKEYVLISQYMKWGDAQRYCREKHTDLVTIQSLDHREILSRIALASNTTQRFWIGLKNSKVQSWRWSSGDTPGIAHYANWASLPSSSPNCGALRADGKWLNLFCNTALPFVCQTDDGSYDVILTNRTWRQAQADCRGNGKNLARARSRTENQAVQEVLNGKGSSFWMGLFRDGYKWSDQSDSAFRYWEHTQPNKDGACVVFDHARGYWFDRPCGKLFHFFCYNAITVTRWMMLKMKSSSSLYFSDSKTSDAVLHQIQRKCTGAKLQWGVQPDGKIFHESNKIIDQHQNASGSACS